jgi:hypothetical protein
MVHSLLLYSSGISNSRNCPKVTERGHPVCPRNGASTLESFPDDPKCRTADGDIYTGTIKLFQELGFTEVGRRHPLRPIMRYEIKKMSTFLLRVKVAAETLQILHPIRCFLANLSWMQSFYRLGHGAMPRSADILINQLIYPDCPSPNHG